MLSINVKGVRNPHDLEMVKLIFFKTGYDRIPKVTHISGKYDDWDQKRQLFGGNTKDIHVHNQLILKEKLRSRRNGSLPVMIGFPRNRLITLIKATRFHILRPEFQDKKQRHKKKQKVKDNQIIIHFSSIPLF